MTAQSSERLHALDAVRGGALLLGIVFHQSMSFWPIRILGFGDHDPSPELFMGFEIAHIFRMSLFFFIAGFFAHLMFHRRGPKGFVADRLKRIGIPFLVGWPVLVIATYVAIFSYIIGHAPPGAAQQSPPIPSAPVWTWVPLMHTWFLWVLLGLYAVMLALVGLVTLVNRGDWLGKAADAVVALLVRSPLAVLVLAAPLAAMFYYVEPWSVGGGIRTPEYGFVPTNNLNAYVGFGTAFAFGWLLHRQPQLLGVLRRWWPLNLALAVVLTLPVLSYMGQLPAGTPLGDMVQAALARLPRMEREVSLTVVGTTLAGKTTLTQAVVYPLAIWTWTFGLVGAALAFLTRENKAIRYLADSSYWLYLLHLPVVVFVSTLFADLAWPWYAKFPIMLAISFAVLLASYQLLVRNTPIGGLLNGRRYGPAPKPRDGGPALPTPQTA